MNTLHNRMILKDYASKPKHEASWHFNLYAILSITVLILLYNNLRMHDEIIALNERLAAYGDCKPIKSRMGDVTIQHCIRTIDKE